LNYSSVIFILPFSTGTNLNLHHRISADRMDSTGLATAEKGKKMQSTIPNKPKVIYIRVFTA